MTPPSPARVEIAGGDLTLRIGQQRTLGATVRDAAGTPMPGRTVLWTTSDAAVATVSAAGLITGVGVGTARITASSDRVSASVQVTIERQRVARVTILPMVTELLIGRSQTYRAYPIDSLGADVAGWPVQWTSSNPTVLAVDAAGTVTAVAAGTAELRATADTARVTVPIRVLGALDMAVAGLSVAQVVQNDSSTVPMVRQGLPAVLNVWLTADAPILTSAMVRAQCFAEGTDTRLWADSVRVDAAFPAALRPEEPSAQFMIPSGVLGSGNLGCEASLDQPAASADTVRSNDRWPRVGRRAVESVAVPDLTITFVPIVLSGDGGTVGNVTVSNVDQYLITTRQLLPLGRIAPVVGGPYTTTTVLGSGGDVAFRSILRELDAKRQLDGYRGHYYGVVRPGPGITFMQYGGFGFIAGRTALSVQVGWFTREASARELVAHELGHNFGSPHAPCGDAASPDPRYPYVDAALGSWGWDVYSVGSATRARVSAVPATARDLMSYCRPYWISDYNYRRMIGGRALLSGAGIGGGAEGSDGGRVVLVRGETGPNGVMLEPPFVTEGRGSQGGEAPGESVVIELVDGRGRIMRRVVAPLLAADHGAAIRSFVALVPVEDAEELATVRVRARDGNVAQRIAAAIDHAAARVAVERRDEVTTIRWDAAAGRELLIRSGAGDVLAIGRGGLVRLPGRHATLTVDVAGTAGTTRRPLTLR